MTHMLLSTAHTYLAGGCRWECSN